MNELRWDVVPLMWSDVVCLFAVSRLPNVDSRTASLLFSSRPLQLHNGSLNELRHLDTGIRNFCSRSTDLCLHSQIRQQEVELRSG